MLDIVAELGAIRNVPQFLFVEDISHDTAVKVREAIIANAG